MLARRALEQVESSLEHGQALRLVGARGTPSVPAAEEPNLEPTFGLSRRRHPGDAPGGNADVWARLPAGGQ